MTKHVERRDTYRSDLKQYFHSILLAQLEPVGPTVLHEDGEQLGGVAAIVVMCFFLDSLQHPGE